jgi:hypothetical protein
MAHRRDLAGVLHNFLGTYTSRYSDRDGYWLFGFLAHAGAEWQVDLLAAPEPAATSAVAEAIALARTRFAEQLQKAEIPRSWLREAHLRLARGDEAKRGVVNGHWTDGHDFTFSAHATTDHGKSFAAEAVVFVAPHDPARAAPNQAMQLTAVSFAINVWDDFGVSTAGDALPPRRS